jgi:hypothetical protein
MGKMGRIGTSSGQGGGMLGSGIFGMFGTVIRCDSTDTSWYCWIMKVFNLLIVFMIVAVMLTAAYNYLSTTSLFRKKSR